MMIPSERCRRMEDKNGSRYMKLSWRIKCQITRKTIKQITVRFSKIQFIFKSVQGKIGREG